MTPDQETELHNFILKRSIMQQDSNKTGEDNPPQTYIFSLKGREEASRASSTSDSIRGGDLSPKTHSGGL